MTTKTPTGKSAFTLIEVMVSVGILAVIMLIVAGFTQQASRTWLSSQARVESFQGARAAFESMTRRLSQTTLNNYYGYDDPENPVRYLRKSELHFISGKSLITGQVTHAVFFQAPLGYAPSDEYAGMDTLLNACGYFIEYNGDENRPDFLDTLEPPPGRRYRYRLMQFTQPSQNLAVYEWKEPPNDDSKGEPDDWFTKPLALTGDMRPVRTLAENIVALVVLPKRTKGDQTAQGLSLLTTTYEYDTRDTGNKAALNQLPPLLEVVMVAIDEPSAQRLGNTETAPDLGQAELFKSYQKADDLREDLAKLEQILTEKRLNYRVFRADVPIKTAKWSAYDEP